MFSTEPEHYNRSRRCLLVSDLKFLWLNSCKFLKIWQQPNWRVDYGISMWTDFWLIATNWAWGGRKRIVVWKQTEDWSFLGYFCLFCSSRLCRAADRHDWPDQGAESQPGHPLLGVQTICHAHVLPEGEKDFCFCDTNPNTNHARWHVIETSLLI